MQSSSAMPWMSFRKNPRSGQKRVFKAIRGRNKLNIRLPTGYGKTYTACGCYSILKNEGTVNRVLFVFPTDAQLEQFVKDGHADMYDCNVDGPLKVVDVRFFKTRAIKKHLKNEAQIYAITVQTLAGNNGMDIIGQLLEKGNWLIVVDEYHHYGIDRAWGKAVLAQNYTALLAMSATPNRKQDDSAFGDPDITVSYREAVDEGALKPLRGHSYNYRIDAIVRGGEVHSFTTDDLVYEAGGDSPEKIERMMITREMRWSGKYVSPLVSIPIERMLGERINTGYKLQAIIGAMCVTHAKLVCDQVRSLFPELSVDWVGTGDNGREDNAVVISKFCPPKDEHGKRHPTLDVLVHVGIAGEGLDSVNVSEVIHLNKASKNNSNDQENGRAARYLPGITGNINFDSSSEYAVLGYVGKKIMDAMDGNDPDPNDESENDPEQTELAELPDEPSIQLFDMYLESINSGDQDVQRLAKVLEGENVAGINYEDLKDKDHPEWDKVIDLAVVMRTKQAEAMDEKSVIMQWQDAVKNASTSVTGRIIRMMTASGGRFEKSLPGDIKKRLMFAKKRACGAITEDIDVCRRHYDWLKALEVQLIDTGVVPAWLQ